MATTDEAFDDELHRRLEAIEAPDYEDPARKDFPTTELAIFAVVSLVVMLLVHVWGY